MKTFNVQVQFCPAYHAATNGAIERRHQTIKNSLKASLVDMGSTHGENWIRALPWVLLGKRIQVQPDLDTSAATLVFGKSLSIPGQILGHPGPPLSNIQTRSLLEGLYKLAAQPALKTTAIVDPIDISATESASHVYVKVHEPRGLSGRFEGPYPVVSRPSRSTVELRMGSYANGTPRLQVFHWQSCKVAHRREDAQDGQRPKLGRRPDPNSRTRVKPATTKQLESSSSGPAAASEPPASSLESSSSEPSAVPEPPTSSGSRPVRSTRNPAPMYVEALEGPVEI